MLTLRNIIWIFLLLFALVVISFSAHAQTPQQTLNQYISDLQNNPDDTALREKIIKHVQTMKPKPAIPREAERFMNRGAAAVKSAKDADDFKDAVAEFEKATLAAPWLASAYYNLGIARDKAGLHADAIKSLNLYLLASPNAADEKAVKKLIDEIEYKQEKAAKESSPEAIAAKQQQEFYVWLKNLDGRRYTHVYQGQQNEEYWSDTTLKVIGKTLVHGSIRTGDEGALIKIVGHETTLTHAEPDPSIKQLFHNVWVVETTYIISQDGERIIMRERFNNGGGRENIYRWQK